MPAGNTLSSSVSLIGHRRVRVVIIGFAALYWDCISASVQAQFEGEKEINVVTRRLEITLKSEVNLISIIISRNQVESTFAQHFRAEVDQISFHMTR